MAMVIAMVLALLTVLGRHAPNAVIRWISTAYVEVVRNTPFIVQIFVIYFGLPAIGVKFDPTRAAIVALRLTGLS